jgi:hypothetical protein
VLSLRLSAAGGRTGEGKVVLGKLKSFPFYFRLKHFSLILVRSLRKPHSGDVFPLFTVPIVCSLRRGCEAFSGMG